MLRLHRSSSHAPVSMHHLTQHVRSRCRAVVSCQTLAISSLSFRPRKFGLLSGRTANTLLSYLRESYEAEMACRQVEKTRKLETTNPTFQKQRTRARATFSDSHCFALTVTVRFASGRQREGTARCRRVLALVYILCILAKLKDRRNWAEAQSALKWGSSL